MPPLPRRSDLESLLQPGSFIWAAGIEDTFITDPHPVTGRTLDEYELTGHYENMQADMDRAARLGVSAMRYGIPWHRTEPARGLYDWSFADQALNYLLELGVDPIVDLVHYGLPPWLEEAYLNFDYPKSVANFAGEIASRFKDRIHWYTPLNEPRITAWYCGRIGWWPPYGRSWREFVAILLSICRGIRETVRTLHQIDPEIVICHVDATDLFTTREARFEAVAKFRQTIVFLPLDLISGRVAPGHELWGWLLAQGATVPELESFLVDPVALDVIGINLYPMFSNKELISDKSGRQRMRMVYGDGSLLTKLVHQYHDRYGVPLIVAETAAWGSLPRRSEWLSQSIAAVSDLRAQGVPIVGYTWWPLFALVTWAYRQGEMPVERYLAQMGLWDLDPDPEGGLARLPTPLVDAYRAHISAGPPGLLMRKEN
jgi:beta-glucosidase